MSKVRRDPRKCPNLKCKRKVRVVKTSPHTVCYECKCGYYWGVDLRIVKTFTDKWWTVC